MTAKRTLALCTALLLACAMPLAACALEDASLDTWIAEQGLTDALDSLINSGWMTEDCIPLIEALPALPEADAARMAAALKQAISFDAKWPSFLSYCARYEDAIAQNPALWQALRHENMERTRQTILDLSEASYLNREPPSADRLQDIADFLLIHYAFAAPDLDAVILALLDIGEAQQDWLVTEFKLVLGRLGLWPDFLAALRPHMAQAEAHAPLRLYFGPFDKASIIENRKSWTSDLLMLHFDTWKGEDDKLLYVPASPKPNTLLVQADDPPDEAMLAELSALLEGKIALTQDPDEASMLLYCWQQRGGESWYQSSTGGRYRAYARGSLLRCVSLADGAYLAGTSLYRSLGETIEVVPGGGDYEAEAPSLAGTVELQAFARELMQALEAAK